jgi:histidine triad (HIT) family protein
VSNEQCVFCRIVKGQLPSRKVYEDDLVLAFHDIHPVAPVHFMIIPKEHVDSMAHLEARHQLVMGKIMLLAGPLAEDQGAKDGFRAIINTGRVGRQDVFHLHMHVLGGPSPLPGMIQRTE